MDLLGIDSCHGTVPMQLLMPTCNGSMDHREPKSEIDHSPPTIRSREKKEPLFLLHQEKKGCKNSNTFKNSK